MDVSDADGEHLDPQSPELGRCFLHLILRFTVCDQDQILGDARRPTTSPERLKVAPDGPQGQADVGASTELLDVGDALGDGLLGEELVEVKLVLEAAAELGQTYPDKVLAHFEAVYEFRRELLHGDVVVGADAAGLIEEEDQVGLLFFTSCRDKERTLVHVSDQRAAR